MEKICQDCKAKATHIDEPCPYEEEIHGNRDVLITVCDKCWQERINDT